MLKELFDALVEQAVSAATPQILTPAAEPSHVYFVRDPVTDKVEKIEAEPKPRAHVAADLEAVAEFAEKYRETAAIWYSRKRVVCLTDDGTRRDAITLPLELSPQLKTVIGFGAGKAFGQPDLIRLLRTMFVDCLGLGGGIIDCLRQVKFKSKVDGESTVKHGQRSVGKQIEQQVEGTTTLPEYLTLQVQVFASAFSHRETLRIALEPDPATEQFLLIAVPGDVEWALVRTEQWLGTEIIEALNGCAVPTYYGDPGTP